jgi:hypothetical protein
MKIKSRTRTRHDGRCCSPSYTGTGMEGLLSSRAAWQHSKTLSQQRQNQNEEGGLAGRVVCDRAPA